MCGETAEHGARWWTHLRSACAQRLTPLHHPRRSQPQVKEAAIKFGDAAIPVLKEGGAVALCAGKEGWELSKK